MITDACNIALAKGTIYKTTPDRPHTLRFALESSNKCLVFSKSQRFNFSLLRPNQPLTHVRFNIHIIGPMDFSTWRAVPKLLDGTRVQSVNACRPNLITIYRISNLLWCPSLSHSRSLYDECFAKKRTVGFSYHQSVLTEAWSQALDRWRHPQAFSIYSNPITRDKKRMVK